MVKKLSPYSDSTSDYYVIKTSTGEGVYFKSFMFYGASTFTANVYVYNDSVQLNSWEIGGSFSANTFYFDSYSFSGEGDKIVISASYNGESVPIGIDNLVFALLLDTTEDITIDFETYQEGSPLENPLIIGY